jgi:DNA polymerase-3 subunit delta
MQKLYHGKNSYLSLRAVNRYIKENYSNYELVVYQAENVDINKIVDDLYSPSLFSTPKIYLLKRVYRNKQKEILIENITKIIEDIEINLVIWEDQKLRSNTKYVKFFKSRDSIEEFDEFNKRTFPTWAKEEIKTYNLNIDSNTLRTLIERSNYEPERYINNLNKLKLVNSKEINIETLNQTVVDTLETDIWKLMDYINQSDTKNITTTLEKLLEYKTDPNYIIAMIARNLRIAIQTKYLLDNNTPDKNIASILKLPPFAVYPVIKSVKHLNKKKLLLQYQKLSNLDTEIKTGRIEPTLGLTLFTLIL